MILPCFPLIVNEKFLQGVPTEDRKVPGNDSPEASSAVPIRKPIRKYKTPSALTEGRSVLLRVFFGRDKSQCGARHCTTTINLASRFFGVNRIRSTSDFSLLKLTKIDTKFVVFWKVVRKSDRILYFWLDCVTFAPSKSFKFCEVSVFSVFSQ